MFKVTSVKRLSNCFVSKMNVFDSNAKMKQRNRVALWPNSIKYDYLKEEVAYRMADRVYDIKRCFNIAVDFGCGRGYLRKHLTEDYVKFLFQVDSPKNIVKDNLQEGEIPTNIIQLDDESFPFKENSLDLVVSYLHLHWINDLPGVMKRICKSLKPDGCFLGVMYGKDTLYELRSAFYLADNEREGGYGPHLAPFVDSPDLGGLLNSAGFNLLTIDLDEIVVHYPTVFELMHDLRGMGNSNCTWSRVSHVPRETLFSVAAIYEELYGLSSDSKEFNDLPEECKNEGRVIPATFKLLHFIGWKPHPSQQKPSKRGSATASFKDLGKIVAEQETNPNNIWKSE